MAVSIIIKALNEEARIGAAIESALAGLAGLEGEVIVADSGSSDRTVEIARRYPVLVVQLANAHERCCGIGPELGFRHAHGDAICLMDGDMEFDAGFLRAALQFLEMHPRFAGVSGEVIETNTDSLEYTRRARRAPADLVAGEVDRLNGGGLFRRAAIEEAGYFTDRNLHGYEEFDLAARLRVRGWRLWRLDIPFVRHYGHALNAYHLLARRWQSGYVRGIGEVTRASLGQPHQATVLRLPEVRLWAGVIASWVVAAALLLRAPSWGAGIALAALVLLGPLAVMGLRYRSLQMGLYAVVAWHVHALGFLVGLLRPRRDPSAPIEARIVADGRLKQPAAHDRTTAR